MPMCQGKSRNTLAWIARTGCARLSSWSAPKIMMPYTEWERMRPLPLERERKKSDGGAK